MALRRLHLPVAASSADTGLRDGWIVAGLTLFALLLRVIQIDFQPLWWDEGYSVWFANQPLAEMLRLTALDIHPPLYYAFLGAWSQLFGLGPVALRFLSVTAGVIAVPLIYALGRALGGRRTGLLAAALLAINPLHIFYSQEVRMYGLVVVFSLLAILSAVHWLGIAGGRRGRAGWLAGYVVAITLALYAQYYAGFLAAALALVGLLALWRMRAGWRAGAVWLAAQAAALVLFFPWLLYAAPRLVPYVSQKIVADSDRPLGLLLYLARHLAAFLGGHLEGPLTDWWQVALLPLIVAAAAFWQLLRSWRAQRQPPAPWSPVNPVGLLALLALLVLLAGWAVNLSFPFFPERGERLLLLALPLLLALLALLLAQATRPLRWVGLGLMVALACASLAAFYITPRYTSEDYRPLIGQVRQWGQPDDTVFAVFPWQVGYFWSYGGVGGPQPLLSPSDDWDGQAQAALDAALARGRVWFPEHLSLGGIFEQAAEEHLAASAYLLANRWYSPSTRLSGWAMSRASEKLPSAPVEFAEGSRLDRVDLGPPAVIAANDTLFLDLIWQGQAPAPRHLTVRLVGEDGRAWAQQDYLLDWPGERDALAMVVPAGTPPGRYTVTLGMLAGAADQAVDVTGPAPRLSGPEAELASVDVLRPATPPAPVTLPIEVELAARLGDAVEALGYSVPADPVASGETVTASLFWRALPGLAGRDLYLVMQLLDPQGAVLAAWEGPPVGWHPTSAWQAGDLVRSQTSLRVPATVASGDYHLIAGLFDPATGERLPVTTDARLLVSTSDSLNLGDVTVLAREHLMTAPQPATVTDAALSRVGRLAGYDLPAVAVASGGQLDLTLYWQASELTGDDLSVFVHLLDQDGQIIGQSDGRPAAGAAPTTSWLPGETVIDQRQVAVRADAAAGPARLVVGLYDPASGVRVLWAGDGADAFTLPDAITVKLDQ